MNLDSTTILLILIPITLVIGAIATARMIKRTANDDSLFDSEIKCDGMEIFGTMNK